jgi:D-alanine-D-alanine ligase-like ATP-grasp enzyme
MSPARFDRLLPGVALLGRAGRRGRTAAALVESARLVGPAPLLRSTRELRRLGVPGRAARNAVYCRIWREAADALGIEFTDLSRGFYELRAGARHIPLFQQVTPIDDAVTLRLALEKPLVHELLTREGVTIPEHVEFSYADPAPALALLDRVDRCVVKPASGTGGGEGVTTEVRSAADVARASGRAAHFGDALLAERQAPGPLHRLLLLDGNLLDTIVERPPRVVGDGRSTVEELMHAENRRRIVARGEAGMEGLLPDVDTAIALREQGAALGDVPAAGHEVQVKTVTNDRRLEDAWTYRGPIDPDVLEQARAAARAVGLRLAGVDVMAPRIDQPLARTGGAILEINGTPGLHRHYHLVDRGSVTPVAIPIIKRLLSQGPAT